MKKIIKKISLSKILIIKRILFLQGKILSIEFLVILQKNNYRLNSFSLGKSQDLSAQYLFYNICIAKKQLNLSSSRNRLKRVIGAIFKTRLSDLEQSVIDRCGRGAQLGHYQNLMILVRVNRLKKHFENQKKLIGEVSGGSFVVKYDKNYNKIDRKTELVIIDDLQNLIEKAKND